MHITLSTVAGSMETDTGQRTSTLLKQIESLKSLDVKALFNEDINEAELILGEADLLSKFKKVMDRDEEENFDRKKMHTDNLATFLGIKDINVVIVSEIDTEIIFNCLIKGKNIINLNAVSEVTLGLIFKSLANSNNVIYSVGEGDEPASTLELVNFCRKLELDIICAGKGKNNPLNTYCTPDDFKQTFKEVSKNKNVKKGIEVSPRNIASFVDGTKTMLEMAILSNATGIPIDKAGMHGPRINLTDLTNTFKLKREGGILSSLPVIDYVIGDIAPGVFVVFTSEQKSIINELQYLKMGDGPNFVLYKPYHLGNIESPLSIYDVMLEKRPTLTVKDKIITSVVAKAKKDLKPEDIIDTVGGYDFSGLAIDYKEMLNKNYVPIGLVEKSKVKRSIEKDKIISFEDIECITDSIINLWNLQVKI